MKKDRAPDKDELRAEYKRSDFPGGPVRGKYAKRKRESSNVVVLKPEVAKAFPNECGEHRPHVIDQDSTENDAHYQAYRRIIPKTSFPVSLVVQHFSRWSSIEPINTRLNR